jgi:hypothetical protein
MFPLNVGEVPEEMVGGCPDAVQVKVVKPIPEFANSGFQSWFIEDDW